ncbi:MAG: tRNA (adenosine(37)-N6)-threonylcarbamoyltransferase complex transferase subunit TsaD [bacterium]
MYILAIETSCDETSAAVLNDGRIQSNIIASQDEHIVYGGVVPELASRAHIAKIVSVVDTALQKGDRKLDQIELVAATYGPGLVGSLLVGLTFAKGIALSKSLPFYGINHLEGHLFSTGIEYPEIKLPYLCLLVSGGHTILALVKNVGEYEIIGQTIDDAAGEAFDKVAKILGLPYPGGPAVEKLAKQGDPHFVKFPIARLKNSSLDFSFSGLKTAVLYQYRNLSSEEQEKHKADIAAAFQKAVIAALSKNIEQALEQTGANTLTMAGGVAQNKTLSAALHELAVKHGCRFCAPRPEYCADNAAMIGYVAHLFAEKGIPYSELSLPAVPNLPLA